MNVDTRNGLVVIIATVALAVVVAVSAVGIVVLALTHDGPLSAEAMDTFKQILLGAGAGGVLLGIVERIVSGTVASKAIGQGASVQGSPVSVTASPPPSQGISDPSGASVAATLDGAGV